MHQGRSYKSYRGMGSIGAMARGSGRPLLPGRGARSVEAGAGRHRGAGCRTRARSPACCTSWPVACAPPWATSVPPT
ncbi:MAG: hypothetical protein WDM94_07615 [Bauldia sp.]